KTNSIGKKTNNQTKKTNSTVKNMKNTLESYTNSKSPNKHYSKEKEIKTLTNNYIMLKQKLDILKSNLENSTSYISIIIIIIANLKTQLQKSNIKYSSVNKYKSPGKVVIKNENKK